MAAPPTVAELLDGHVSLDVECFDRLYLNAYVPKLQTAGGTVYFLHEHRGNAIPSPALFRPMGQAFRDAVATFATDRGVPVVRFPAGARKLDLVRPHLEQAAATGTPGVVAVGVAQETQLVTMGTDVRRAPNGVPTYSFRRLSRRVTCFYFYIWDAEWGPCFVKLCAYFPYPGKVWCNGHEWAKRQLEARGIAYTSLANGFASCADPKALRRICASLSPRKVQALFNRWMAVLPLPLTPEDRAAGYDWELSMNQVEFSRTLVLDRPARARAFFDRVIAEGIELGRPSEVEVIFGRRVQSNTPGIFHARVITRGTEPRLSIYYKSSRVKEYLKEGRAVRVETVINCPTDIGVHRRIAHLGELGAACREVNRRILRVQRVASAPSMTRSGFERVTLPDERAGHRTVALRYGDARAMALMAALALCLHHVAGFTNKTLRPVVANLLGGTYSATQMTYDLWRLRGKELIRRIEGTHTYFLTPEGVRVATFFTKSFRRIIDPLFAAAESAPPPEPQLRAALAIIEHTVDRYAQEAGMAA